MKKQSKWSKVIAVLLLVVMVFQISATTTITVNARQVGISDCPEMKVEAVLVRPGTWKCNATGWWYEYEDGTYSQNEFVKIDDQIYYFGSHGYMVTDWQYLNDHWYYFKSSGARAVGWNWIDGNCYYFYQNGVMAANEYIDMVDYVDETGAWRTDQWIYSTYAGKYWYRFADGNYPRNQFLYIDHEYFYFDGDGYMVTGWQYAENVYTNSVGWYYFNSSGYMLTGWQYIDGYWYFMDADGNMFTDLCYIDDKNYYFAQSGHMVTGWTFFDHKWFYFYEDGHGALGWNWIDGKCYYFDNLSSMVTDTTIDGYYVDENGVWVS